MLKTLLVSLGVILFSTVAFAHGYGGGWHGGGWHEGWHEGWHGGGWHEGWHEHEGWRWRHHPYYYGEEYNPLPYIVVPNTY